MSNATNAFRADDTIRTTMDGTGSVLTGDLRDSKLCATAFEPAHVPKPHEPMKTILPLRGSTEGELYVVRSLTTGSVYVKKVLNHRMSRYGFISRAAPAEVDALKRLCSSTTRHRNVVQLFLVGNMPDGRYVLTEEYCDGGDLIEQMAYFGRISGHSQMPSAFICQAFVHIASGLAWIHQGLHRRDNKWEVHTAVGPLLMHGDIKADNIVLRWTPQSQLTQMPDLVITDFGHSVPVRDGMEYYGTPDYTPPEVQENKWRRQLPGLIQDMQARGQIFSESVLEKHRLESKTRVPISEKADIYCFGVIMSMLLRPGNRPPNTWKDPMAQEIPSDDFPIPSLVAYVQACLDRDVDRRLPTMMEIPANTFAPAHLSEYCLTSAVDCVSAALYKLIREPRFHIPPSTWYRGPGVSLALLGINGTESRLDPNLNILDLSQIHELQPASSLLASFYYEASDIDMIM